MAEPVAHVTLQGRRILLVEDDYLMAQDLQAELEDAGALVLGPVPDIEGAMDLLNTSPAPDAAVLDINLGCDMVYPLVYTLRERLIRVVFATGYEAWSIPERYRDLPRLEKPLSVRQIAEALNRNQ
ncbi:response regulator [Rubellimicrobium arenae]|uniref:response regulator n=1 Tax=Rubellimicrobium arenae TaxID=2817372 RepID=UPI001B30FDF8|nr:response regulator [Rubellimicrobium arenae]